MTNYHVYVGPISNLVKYCLMTLCFIHIFIQDIASTCLFIATKVEECTRRFKDIVLACAQKASKNDNLQLKEDSKEFLRWKESLLHNEILVLDTLCFDLSVEHPHTSLMRFQSQISGKMV